MATVRLILYDASGCEVASDIAGETILDAATDAAVRGMETDMNFLVVEPEGAPFALYWAGRRAQKVTREVARALLSAKLDAKAGA